jgi:hypothetical protein
MQVKEWGLKCYSFCATLREFDLLKVCAICLLTFFVPRGIMEIRALALMKWAPAARQL